MNFKELWSKFQRHNLRKQKLTLTLEHIFPQITPILKLSVLMNLKRFYSHSMLSTFLKCFCNNTLLITFFFFPFSMDNALIYSLQECAQSVLNGIHFHVVLHNLWDLCLQCHWRCEPVMGCHVRTGGHFHCSGRSHF